MLVRNRHYSGVVTLKFASRFWEQVHYPIFFNAEFCFLSLSAIYYQTMRIFAKHSIAIVGGSPVKTVFSFDLSSNTATAELIEPLGLLVDYERSYRYIIKIFGLQWLTATKERNK